MKPETQELINDVLARDPKLGVGDESKCLPSWLESLARSWNEGGDLTLSHNAAGNLFHLLVAAKQRAARLVSERDKLRAEVERLRAIVEGIQPGRPEATAMSVFLLAEEKCGHPSISSRPAILAVEEEIDRLRNLLRRASLYVRAFISDDAQGIMREIEKIQN